MEAPYHGSCLCGGIEFQVDSEPVIVSACHCKNCQKFTGTVFTTNAVFPAGSVTVTKGASLVSTYVDTAQDSGNALQRKFCSQCGTPLYCDGGDFGRTLAVFYSALDDFRRRNDGKDFAPRAPEVEYYSKDRIEWVGRIEKADQPKTKPGREE